MKYGWLLCVWLFSAVAAKAEPIMADLSARDIAIHTTFRGAEVLLFGARGDAGDIVVVVRGPAADYVVRRKERIGGIWVNRHSQTFLGIPSFYQLASSRKMEEIENAGLMQAVGVGGEFLWPQRVEGDARNRDFWEALVQQKRREALYTSVPLVVSFWGETLFKTTLPFPKNIPEGTYLAEVYLFRDGGLSAMQTSPIRIEKIGFEAFVSSIAHRQPLLYGLICVGLALLAGWVASNLFRKI